MTEEQIKQKAEEYAEKKLVCLEDFDDYKTAYNRYEKDVAQAFIDGYECQKEHEWHYVKDGDLPKAYQKCYFIYSNSYNDNGVVFSESNINVLTGLYAFYLDEETGEETTDPCFYDDINDDEISPLEVYAWKEIVLPELPKEIE